MDIMILPKSAWHVRSTIAKWKNSLFCSFISLSCKDLSTASRVSSWKSKQVSAEVSENHFSFQHQISYEWIYFVTSHSQTVIIINQWIKSYQLYNLVPVLKIIIFLPIWSLEAKSSKAPCFIFSENLTEIGTSTCLLILVPLDQKLQRYFFFLWCWCRQSVAD